MAFWRPWEISSLPASGGPENLGQLSSLPSTSSGLDPRQPKRRSWQRGKTLSSSAQQIVLNVMAACKAKKQTRSSLVITNVIEQTAFLCGISRRTVHNIANRSEDNDGRVSSPGRKRARKSLPKIDGCDLHLIRKRMHDHFKANSIVTLNILHAELKDDLPSFPYSRVTLWRILKQEGFKFKKRGNRLYILERPEIVHWRSKYIRAILAMRAAGKQIVYTDETWVNQGYTTSHAWYDKKVEDNPFQAQRRKGLSLGYKDPSGKGQRLIISHVGGSNGFIPNMQDVFRSKKTGDFHEEMNSERWEAWLENLSKQLPKGTVIVIDNASYHSRVLDKAPTTATKKADMQKWLADHKIPYPATAKKDDLYKNYILPKKERFVTHAAEAIAESNGCEILRLPPYHCELNPIELIWATLKQRVAKRNTTFKLADVERLVNEELTHISADEWKKAIGHVEKIEIKYSTMIAPLHPTLLIDFDSDSSDNTSPSSSSSQSERELSDDETL